MIDEEKGKSRKANEPTAHGEAPATADLFSMGTSSA